MTIDVGQGWLLVQPRSVPEAWLERAIPMALIPLSTEEASEVLGRISPANDVDPADDTIIDLLIQGLTTAAISNRLAVSERSVQRRLASLRERLGAKSNAQLVAMLSERRRER